MSKSGFQLNPDATWGNDDQAKFNRESVGADEKFRSLMLDHHGDRCRVVTAPGTDQPRYIGPRSMPLSRGGSPAALCAEHGSGEHRGLKF